LPIGVKTIEEEKEFLKKQQEAIARGETHQYSIFCEGKIVGGIGLKLEGKKIGELGYFVGKKFHKKGIATEAAKQVLEIARQKGFIGIKATAHPLNVPSRKVLEHTGFNLVGEMEKYMEIRGELQPRVLYWLSLK